MDEDGDAAITTIADNEDSIVELRLASRLLQSVSLQNDEGMKITFAVDSGLRIKPPAKESIYREITAAERRKYKLPARYTLFYLKFSGSNVEVGQYDRDYTVDGTVTTMPLDKDVIKAVTKALVADIRAGKAKADATNFRDILFRERRYIIFFIDNKGLEFHRKDDGQFDSVEFVVQKLNKKYDKNHSFFDGGDISFAPADGIEFEGRSLTYMVNYLKKNEAGDDNDGTKTSFCFEAFVRMPFASGTGHDGRPLTIVIDPTGGNQGPPPDP